MCRYGTWQRRAWHIRFLDRGQEGRVHAAILPGTDRRRCGSISDQIRRLALFALLLLFHSGNDVGLNLVSRAISGGRELGLRFGVEYVALVANIDLGLLTRHFEM